MTSATHKDDPFCTILKDVPEGIRRSKLLLAMNEKLAEAHEKGPSLITEFGRLRDVIALHIMDTRILFPEFTPHDETLHVCQLFHLADMFFGPNIYKNMNCAELFLLACALYAHDWGMAVGSDEITYLRGLAKPEDVHPTFTPLSDEVNRLRNFAPYQSVKYSHFPV